MSGRVSVDDDDSFYHGFDGGDDHDNSVCRPLSVIIVTTRNVQRQRQALSLVRTGGTKGRGGIQLETGENNHHERFQASLLNDRYNDDGEARRDPIYDSRKETATIAGNFTQSENSYQHPKAVLPLSLSNDSSSPDKKPQQRLHRASNCLGTRRKRMRFKIDRIHLL